MPAAPKQRDASSPTKQIGRASSSGVISEAKRRREEKVRKLALRRAGREPTEFRMLFEDEYRHEVTQYMHEMEERTRSSIELMEMQPELKWYMRPFLVDFLIEIHQQFRLRPEVLYLSMNIVDRYVSKRVVYKKHYQLVGCAALWIAAKFEDAKDRVPTVEQLGEMCCRAYDESAFLQMEGHVLSTIGWIIGHPTAESWLRLACMGTSVEDAETQHVARFIMEISLFHKEFVSYLPSTIAAGALLLSRYLLNKPRRASLSLNDPAVQVAFALDAILGEHLENVSEIAIAKYSHHYYNRSSTFVREEYLKGRRFELYVPPPDVITPIRTSFAPSLFPSWTTGLHASSSSPVSSSPHRTFSSSSTSSDAGEEQMPVTPVTPVWHTIPDPFSSASVHKENRPYHQVRYGSGPVAVGGKGVNLGNEHVPMDVTMHGGQGYVVQEPRAALGNLNEIATSFHNNQVPSSQTYTSLKRRFSG